MVPQSSWYKRSDRHGPIIALTPDPERGIWNLKVPLRKADSKHKKAFELSIDVTISTASTNTWRTKIQLRKEQNEPEDNVSIQSQRKLLPVSSQFHIQTHHGTTAVRPIMVLFSDLLEHDEAEDGYCCVCAEAFVASDIPSAMNCTHPPRICGPCYGMNIAAHIGNGLREPIVCPECRVPLHVEEIREYTSPSMWEQYEQSLKAVARIESHTYQFCNSPIGCHSVQVHDPSNPEFVCCRCQYAECIDCKVPWHEKETCEEYKFRSLGHDVPDYIV
jgi:hypothetical protein